MVIDIIIIIFILNWISEKRWIATYVASLEYHGDKHGWPTVCS